MESILLIAGILVGWLIWPQTTMSQTFLTSPYFFAAIAVASTIAALPLIRLSGLTAQRPGGLRFFHFLRHGIDRQVVVPERVASLLALFMLALVASSAGAMLAVALKSWLAFHAARS